MSISNSSKVVIIGFAADLIKAGADVAAFDEMGTARNAPGLDALLDALTATLPTAKAAA